MFKKIKWKDPEPEFFSLSSEVELNLSGTHSAGLDNIMSADSWFCQWIKPSLDEDWFEEDSLTSRYPRAKM